MKGIENKMNTLRVKILQCSDNDRIKDLVLKEDETYDGHELICISGVGINAHDLARAKENNSFPFFWKAHRNSVYSVLFFLCNLSLLIFNLSSSCLVMYKVCEYRIECYAYMFPVCFILVITGSSFSMFETIRSKWGSKILFHVENNCAFVYRSWDRDNNHNMVMIIDNDDIKSKAYTRGKAFPITLLHCRIWDTFSNIKVAAFHLPNEISLHQAVGCDAMDILRPPLSLFGVLVVFYQNSNDLTEECIDNFVGFLNKSGFTVVLHKRNFVIVGINTVCASNNDDGCYFDINLPITI
jgi:hypothetical protein